MRPDGTRVPRLCAPFTRVYHILGCACRVRRSAAGMLDIGPCGRQVLRKARGTRPGELRVSPHRPTPPPSSLGNFEPGATPGGRAAPHRGDGCPRFACVVVGQNRTTRRRAPASAAPAADPDAGLRTWLRAYRQGPSAGVRRAYHDARADGWIVNHSKLQRKWGQITLDFVLLIGHMTTNVRYGLPVGASGRLGGSRPLGCRRSCARPDRSHRCR